MTVPRALALLLVLTFVACPRATAEEAVDDSRPAATNTDPPAEQDVGRDDDPDAADDENAEAEPEAAPDGDAEPTRATRAPEKKVELEEPEEGAAEKSLAEELRDLPDGVLKVKTNRDGGFKSLVVKATVEIEDVLGGQKGKRLARKDAELQCKRALAQWLEEHCAFVEAQGRVVAIVTEGESAKDADGNTVKLRKQKGVEVKSFSEGGKSTAAAVLRGLIALSSEVTAGEQPEYVLVMGLSDKTLSQAAAVRSRLAERGRPESRAAAGRGEKGGAGGGGADDDEKPAPEQKINPEAEDFR